MDVINYKCINCANSLVFDPSLHVFKCSYCNSAYRDFEIRKIYGSKIKSGAEIDNYTGKEVDNSDFAGAFKEYRCNNCGANIVSSKDSVASFCIFCKSPLIIIDKIRGEFEQDKVIPFRISKSEVENIYYQYIKKHFFAPKSFLDKSVIAQIVGIYVPAILFDVKVFPDLAKVEDLKKIYNQTILINASSYVTNEQMMKIEPFNLKEIRSFDPSYLSGFFAQKRDLNSEFINVQGGIKFRTKFLNLSPEILANYVDYLTGEYNLGNKKQYNAMLPIYYVAVRHKKELLPFIINGQSGKIYGLVPIDSIKMLFGIVIAIFSFRMVVLPLLKSLFLTIMKII